MKSEKEKLLSLKFLILISIMILVIVLYAITPTANKLIIKKIKFEDNIERSVNDIEARSAIKNKNENEETEIKKTKVKTTKEIIISEAQIPQNSYNVLLDELKQYPSKSNAGILTIINRLIKYKGYKQDLIKITEDEPNPKGSYTAAYFDFISGEMHINKDVLFKLSTKQIVPILAHETEHFDTIAKIIKSMGEEEFFALMQKNNINNINKEFWIKASKQANIKGFKSKHYKMAIEKYVNQKRLDIISSYADLYMIFARTQNPLEIIAFGVSDYISDYYKLPKDEGILRNITNEFNKLDWQVYKISQKNKNLKNERIAIYDYLIMKSLIKSNEKYKIAYEYCTKDGKGDLTQFWQTFKNENKSLYDTSLRIDKETYNNIINLLKDAQKEGEKELTPKEITEALKYETYTLLSNLLYNNSMKQLATSAIDLLEYGKENNTLSSKDELKLIFILICVKNKIYSNTEEKLSSLYYIKLPSVIEKMYKPKNKNQKYNCIYKNPTFKNILKEKKTQNPRITEQELLLNMLEENRLYYNVVK